MSNRAVNLIPSTRGQENHSRQNMKEYTVTVRGYLDPEFLDIK